MHVHKVAGLQEEEGKYKPCSNQKGEIIVKSCSFFADNHKSQLAEYNICL